MPQMRPTDRQFPMPELRVSGNAGDGRNRAVEKNNRSFLYCPTPMR